MESASDYQLPELSASLQRRQGWLGFTGLTAVFIPIMLIGLSIGSNVKTGFVISSLIVMVSMILLNRLIHLTMPATDRSAIDASVRRELDPLPILDPHRVHQIELRLPKHRTSLAEQRHHIVIDSNGITLPLWSLVWVPQRMKRSVTAGLTIEWRNVKRWTVRSDSDGIDTYDIETTHSWYDTKRKRWPNLRVDRSVVANELELLDAVRSLGGTPVELHTSIQMHPANAIPPGPRSPGPP